MREAKEMAKNSIIAGGRIELLIPVVRSNTWIVHGFGGRSTAHNV